MYGDADSFSRLTPRFTCSSAARHRRGTDLRVRRALADAIMLAMLTAPRGGAP
jgi:hypothetical protein